MFGDGPLTFQEFATRESLPLARVHDAVLEFLRGRDDVVLYGAQAVNAYIDEPRMTQDVDLVSTRTPELAEELVAFLESRFGIDVSVKEGWKGQGYRIYEVRTPENRHLVDLRSVDALPPAKRVRKVLVATPPELIASKVKSMVGRRNRPRGMIDHADLARLLLTFPDLKAEEGPVAERLWAGDASAEVLAAWKDLVAQEILPEDEDEDEEFGSPDQ